MAASRMSGISIVPWDTECSSGQLPSPFSPRHLHLPPWKPAAARKPARPSSLFTGGVGRPAGGGFGYRLGQEEEFERTQPQPGAQDITPVEHFEGKLAFLPRGTPLRLVPQLPNLVASVPVTNEVAYQATPLPPRVPRTREPPRHPMYEHLSAPLNLPAPRSEARLEPRWARHLCLDPDRPERHRCRRQHREPGRLRQEA